MRAAMLFLLLVLPATLLPTLRPAAPPAEPHRSPIDMALLPDGRYALTANHTSHSVSLVDLEAGTLLAEVPAGNRPAAIAVTPDGKRAAVSNLWDGSVTLYDLGTCSIIRTRTLPVGPLPRGLCFAPDGILYVAVSGSNHVVGLDPATGKTFRNWAAPREPFSLTLSPDGALLACASSRSGQVRLWELKSGKLVWERSIVDGFNLRGLAFDKDGKHVLAAHCVRRDFPVSRENIDRGWVIDNRLTRFPVKPDLVPSLEQIALDPRGQAVADPHGLLYSPDDLTLALTVSGTNELLLFQTKAVTWSGGDPGDFIDPDLLWDDGRLRRIPTAARPLSFAFRPGGKELALVGYFGDCIQIVDVKSGKITRTIHLGGPSLPGPQRQGDMLYHDARRSHNHWFSCHTCHPDGHTSGQNFDTLNDDSYGDPKLTPTLRGVARTAPYTWHGWQKSLHEAVAKSFKDTMYGKEPTKDEISSVVSYLATLDHPASPLPANDAVRRGKLIFQGKARCARCHAAPEYTTPRNYDVKLAPDGSPYTGWNPPTLRGLWDRGPFLHDGRCLTLEEVLTRWHASERLGGAKLTPGELADLIAFLESL